MPLRFWVSCWALVTTTGVALPPPVVPLPFLRSRRWRYATTNCICDGAKLFDECLKLIGEERLRSVGQCIVRMWMHLNDYAIRAGSERCSRHWRDFIANTCSMARISNNRQMRELVYSRNSGEVEHVP